MDLSIVIPVFNEEKNIPLLYKKLSNVLNNLNLEYEIIFIDDGSTDGSFEEIAKVHNQDKRVKVIKFRKNFGKASALSAGFNESSGNIIVTMDGDLQDDPRNIPVFLKELENYDLVVGWRLKRKDSIIKKICSLVFNFLTRKLTNVKLHDFNCNYRAIRKSVIENLNLYGGLYRFIPVLAYSKGYKIKEIEISHSPRLYGKSKYSIGRLLGGFLDLFTLKFLISFSKKPLHFFGGIGLLSSFVGFLLSVYLVYLWSLSIKIGDRPLLILAILLIILGIQFISIGLIGELLVNKKKKEFIIDKVLR